MPTVSCNRPSEKSYSPGTLTCHDTAEPWVNAFRNASRFAGSSKSASFCGNRQGKVASSVDPESGPLSGGPNFSVSRTLRRSRSLRDQPISHGSQHGVSYFMLKRKTDDGIKQVRAGNNLFDRLFNIPIERETENRLFEKIFCVDSAGANGVRPV